MRNLMGSAFGADFEGSKTGDIKTEYMDSDDLRRRTDPK